jgi:hypothetical protein
MMAGGRISSSARALDAAMSDDGFALCGNVTPVRSVD